MDSDEYCDVLILGAGAAGIGAARRLLEEGGKNAKAAVVLEARDRAGGRAWASDELACGLELDHGGKWIHGSTSPSNPMTRLARQYKIPTTATARDAGDAAEFRRKRRRRGRVTRVVLRAKGNNGGVTQSAAPSRKAEAAAKLLFEQLCQSGRGSLVAPLMHRLPEEASYKDGLIELANEEMPGKSFSEWLESKALHAMKARGNANSISNLIRETIALLRLRVYERMENYEGCRLDECSLRHAYDGTILPGPNADVAGGYGKLVRALASGAPLDIRLNHRVISIDRSDPRGVAVVCTRGEGPCTKKRFIARLGCIVTVPLGVLQKAIDHVAGETVFVPPLPENLQGAVDRLTMCLMNKIEVLFPSRWWPNGTGTLVIASESGNATDNFPLGDMPWSHWIVEDDSPPVLVCYATGLFAERIEGMTNEAVEQEAMEALRLAFRGSGTGITSIPEPVRTHVTRWRSDPFARGSWTFFKAGTRGINDVSAFQKFNSKMGVIERLYFAGEHTCDGSVPGLDIGTIHGAYVSGSLAMEGLLKSCAESVDLMPT